MKKLYENPRLLAYEYAAEELIGNGSAGNEIPSTGDNDQGWGDF